MTTATTPRTTAKFTRLADGSWGVRITGALPATGTTIKVHKADHTVTTVVTGATVTTVGDVHIVRIVSTPRPTAPRPTAPRATYTTGGVQVRMTRGCIGCNVKGAMCESCAHDGD